MQKHWFHQICVAFHPVCILFDATTRNMEKPLWTISPVLWTNISTVSDRNIIRLLDRPGLRRACNIQRRENEKHGKVQCDIKSDTLLSETSTNKENHHQSCRFQYQKQGFEILRLCEKSPAISTWWKMEPVEVSIESSRLIYNAVLVPAAHTSTDGCEALSANLFRCRRKRRLSVVIFLVSIEWCAANVWVKV